jgi:hypothetical protein
VKPRAISIVAILVLCLTLAVYAFGLVAGASRGYVEGMIDFSLPDVAWVIPFLGFSVIGSIVASKQRHNLIGWLFVATGLLMVVNFAGMHYAGATLGGSWEAPGGSIAAWLGFWAWVPAFGLFPAFFVLFPTGRPPSPRWRWLVWAVAAAEVAVVVGALHVSPDLGLQLLQTSTFSDVASGGLLEFVANGLLPLLTLAAVVSLIVRFRRATAAEHQQIKWFAYGAGLMGFALVVPAFTPYEDPISVWWVGLLTMLATLSLPTAAGIAILKYRLYDIDLIINCTLVYGVLTAALALVYLAIVVVLQGLVPGAQSSDIAVAGSTLAVAALFRPARARIQSFIDRRFYRRKYDAAKTLAAFTARLRDEIDLQTLNAELLSVIYDTMQPTHASLWLRESAE